VVRVRWPRTDFEAMAEQIATESLMAP
jgi:hypothetical protein